MVVPTPAAGQLEARLALEAQLARQQALLASIDQGRIRPPDGGVKVRNRVAFLRAELERAPAPAPLAELVVEQRSSAAATTGTVRSVQSEWEGEDASPERALHPSALTQRGSPRPGKWLPSGRPSDLCLEAVPVPGLAVVGTADDRVVRLARRAAREALASARAARMAELSIQAQAGWAAREGSVAQSGSLEDMPGPSFGERDMVTWMELADSRLDDSAWDSGSETPRLADGTPVDHVVDQVRGLALEEPD